MKTKKGFTLIELLIVIAIIGILSAALLPTILNAPARGRDAARTGNLNSVVAALEAYNSDNGHYPNTAGENCVVDITGFGDYFAGKITPSDPAGVRTEDNLPEGVTDPGGCLAKESYYYRYVGDPEVAEYILGTVMENVNANNSATEPSVYDGDLGAAPFAYYILIK